MKSNRLFRGLPVLIVLLGAAALPASGDAPSVSESPDSSFQRRGRHGVTLHGGVLSRITVQSDVDDGNARSEVRDSGVFGTVSYAYWVGQDWNVGLG